MKLVAFDDDEIWREEFREACEARGFQITLGAHPGDIEISEVLCADVIICDNKFAEHGFLGADFVRKLQSLNFAGISILYTNFPRTVDRAILSEKAWVISKERSFECVLDAVVQQKL